MTWHVVRHPLVGTDVFRMASHIAEQSGSEDAAERRLVEVEATIATIAENPLSGTRLDGRLTGFLRRQSQRDKQITVVFRPDPAQEVIYIHLVAFGGQNWENDARLPTVSPAAG